MTDNVTCHATPEIQDGGHETGRWFIYLDIILLPVSYLIISHKISHIFSAAAAPVVFGWRHNSTAPDSGVTWLFEARGHPWFGGPYRLYTSSQVTRRGPPFSGARGAFRKWPPPPPPLYATGSRVYTWPFGQVTLRTGDPSDKWPQTRFSTYKEHLVNLGLDSLQYWRVKADLLFW